jgi:small subunit ribosomal protein S18
MARNNDRGGSSRRAPKDAGRRIKKKPCALCKDRVEWVDYKDVAMLRKFMSDRGKIRARRVSGNCTQHQRDVAVAIKTARELVLLPYTQRTTTERPGGRRGFGGGRRGRDGDRGPAPERPASGSGETTAPARPEGAAEGAPAAAGTASPDGAPTGGNGAAAGTEASADTGAPAAGGGGGAPAEAAGPPPEGAAG